MRSLFRRLPGFSALDRLLARRYLGAGGFRERFPRGHYYSPLPDLREIESSHALFTESFPANSGIDLAEERQRTLFRTLAAFDREFDWPRTATEGRRFHLGQTFFCEGDARVLYAMLRHVSPRRVIEVGSGFSSALMLDARERVEQPPELTFIEPYTERLESLLLDSDRSTARIVKRRVQEVPVAEFASLESGDILFIDSSHVSRIGSDVNYLYFEVLPALKPGVIVHVHDVLWPFEYPRKWLLEGRAWNEAYLLRAFLQYNSAFDVMLFNAWLGHAARELAAELMPGFLNNPGGSFWMRKRA